MNPFGAIQVILLAVEGAAHILNPKLRKETKTETKTFLVFYWCLLLFGLAIMAWFTWRLYQED